MTDRFALGALPDDELGAALSLLGRELAIPAPSAGDDPARRARQRIEGARAERLAGPGPWRPWRPRRLRRSLVLAVIALLALAAVAAARGFGVPGIRIVFAPPGSSIVPSARPSVPGASPAVRPSAPPASISPSPDITLRPPASGGLLGQGLGLGVPFAVADAERVADVVLRFPPDPPYGPPLAAWSLDGRISLVWPDGASLPATREPGIGLILGQFRGSINTGFFEKILQPGTEISAVLVEGEVGWWISGEPHELIFLDAAGQPVFESHRVVGDTLIWARGDVTYRLESGLGRAGAVALAESLR
jgi:hypothetical protein